MRLAIRLLRPHNIHTLSPYNTSKLIFSYNRSIKSNIKSGLLSNALQLFDEMPMRDVISYNLLISGYKQNGVPLKAFRIYTQLINEGFKENPSTFSSVLSVCSSFGLYFEGMQVHCRVVSLGYFGNMYIDSAIVDLYLQMGLVDIGVKVLEQMPVRNCVVWSLVLCRFCEMGLGNEVVGLCKRIGFDGVELNEVMVCYLIRNCCNGGLVMQGEQLHCYGLKAGFDISNLFVANALVDFYSVCGCLNDVLKSFEVIPYEDVISWNSVVYAYACNGMMFDAVGYFTMMQVWGRRPSVRSFVALLNSCSESEDVCTGKQIHCIAVKLGFDCISTHVQCALIDMYGKCYDIESSADVYESCSEITTECCNAMLTSMLHCNLLEEVVDMFKFMVGKGIKFDEVSLSTTLKAMSCCSFASLSTCKLLHSSAIKSGLGSHVVVSSSLIDLYSKLGRIDHSHQVFESLLSPNVVCFTSIINGYAWNGLGTECLKLFETMVQKGLKPDKVTFLCVLTGCNHSGLVDEGRWVFDSMKTVYGIDPDQRHCSCMVDLLGRAGLVHEAEELLKKSSTKDDSTMWSSLLRSCRVHKNKIVGENAAKCLMELEPGEPSAFLQASRFYSEVGDSELAVHYREIAIARKAIREIGYSFINDS